MTYILGWKTGSAVYLAADSAIEHKQSTNPTNPTRVSQSITSSFGERSVYEPQRTVIEGVQKLINLGDAAVAICGDYGLCREVVTTFKDALSIVDDPRMALEVAVKSNGPFNDPNRQVHLIVAFPESPKPALLAFNIEKDQIIHEVQTDHLVQFGSIDPAHKSVSPQMIKRLRSLDFQSDQLLVCTLAFLQSYGIHSYLLEHGVGGTFSGLTIGGRSIEWQKDILFCLHNVDNPDVNLVSSIVRDHVLVVRSTLSNSCNYFGDSLTGGLNDDWKARWWDPAFEFPKGGQFDFVVLLNTRFRIITVVEMLKHLTSAHLRISPVLSEGSGDLMLNLASSPVLTEAMMEPLQNRHDGSMGVKFNWFPYESPD